MNGTGRSSSRKEPARRIPPNPPVCMYIIKCDYILVHGNLCLIKHFRTTKTRSQFNVGLRQRCKPMYLNNITIIMDFLCMFLCI